MKKLYCDHCHAYILTEISGVHEKAPIEVSVGYDHIRPFCSKECAMEYIESREVPPHGRA